MSVRQRIRSSASHRKGMAKMSDSPRLGFRTAEQVKDALAEIAKEQNISMSQLLNHAVLVVLAGFNRVPENVGWRLDKYVKPTRELNGAITVVTNWPDHIPPELVKAVDCVRRW